MTTRPIRIATSLALVVTLLLTALSGTALAGKAEKKSKKQPRPKGPPAAIEIVKGQKLKLAKAKVTKRWYRFQDEIGDQQMRDGTPVVDAPRWTDLKVVNVANFRATEKLLNKMEQDYPEGTARAYRGAESEWGPKDQAFYVFAVLDGKIPSDLEPGVQIVVTFDGPDAVPLQVGSGLGPYAGAESFSISGSFENGPWASGTTDLSDWQPPEPVPLFNAASRDMGYYDRKTGALAHVARVPKGATSATVTLRSDGDQGEVFDQLVLPFGGRFMELGDPTWGLELKRLGEAVDCRSVATVGTDDETGMTAIEYTVGWQDDADLSEQVAALGDAVPVPVTEVGSEDDPLVVDATVTLAPGGSAATFMIEVPAGQWHIGAVEGEGLPTPAGQALIDLRPLTGSGGVLTGDGLDGLVAGDVDCGVAEVAA